MIIENVRLIIERWQVIKFPLPKYFFSYFPRKGHSGNEHETFKQSKTNIFEHTLDSIETYSVFSFSKSLDDNNNKTERFCV